MFSCRIVKSIIKGERYWSWVGCQNLDQGEWLQEKGGRVGEGIWSGGYSDGEGEMSLGWRVD